MVAGHVTPNPEPRVVIGRAYARAEGGREAPGYENAREALAKRLELKNIHQSNQR